MKRHTFLVAANLLVLLVAAISFATLAKLFLDTRGFAVHISPAITKRGELAGTRFVPDYQASGACFRAAFTVSNRLGSGFVLVRYDETWTVLAADGTWNLRHYRPTDTSYRNKLFWWREGYDWRRDQQPAVRITGVRLDSSDPPVVLSEHGNGSWTNDEDHSFIVDGIDLPTLGCWKLTARYTPRMAANTEWRRFPPLHLFPTELLHIGQLSPHGVRSCLPPSGLFNLQGQRRVIIPLEDTSHPPTFVRQHSSPGGFFDGVVPCAAGSGDRVARPYAGRLPLPGGRGRIRSDC